VELVILFIIIAIVSNVFKAIGNSQPSGPRQAVPRPEQQMKPNVEHSQNRQSSLSGMGNGIPEKWRKASEPSEGPVERKELKDFAAVSQEASESASQVVSSNAFQEPSRASANGLQLQFTSDKILEAVILSEILQPPLSKRR